MENVWKYAHNDAPGCAGEASMWTHGVLYTEQDLRLHVHVATIYYEGIIWLPRNLAH